MFYNRKDTIMKKNWYAVYTKPKCEKKVVASLSKKKIESYCPLYSANDQYSNEKKRNSLDPLFPSYVFVNITESEMGFVKKQSDIINFVYWLGRPVNISDIEIESIQQFLNDYFSIQLEKTVVSKNNLVRIVTKEPSKSDDSNIFTLKRSTIKITLPSLGYVLVAASDNVEIEVDNNSMKVLHLVS